MAGALRSAIVTSTRCCYKHLDLLSRLPPQNIVRIPAVTNSRLLLPSLFHTSNLHHDLMEFFDNKKNWGEENVKTGRPWRLDELRIKSNDDLHKLWYILLKERNMLFTMQHEYEKQSELFPNPERIEKVEESMENIMEVVKERDEAYHVLETGKSSDLGGRYLKNFLGLRQWKNYTEHRLPAHLNKHFFLRFPKFTTPKIMKYVALYKEKLRMEHRRARRNEEQRKKRLVEKFPHLEGKL